MADQHVLDRLRLRAGAAGTGLKVLGTAGVIRPYSPRVLAGLARTLRTWGTGPAGGFASLALRFPDRPGVVDERGSVTFGDLHRRSNALARALAELGVGEGDGVALMCRNHRGFVEASIAATKLGADLLYLNTAFAGPQLVDVLEREQPQVVIHDEEFTELLADAESPQRVLAWTEEQDASGSHHSGTLTVEELVQGRSDADLDPPDRHGRIIILTSGTTGTPKGAPRAEAGIDAAVALLSRMPLRHGWRTHVAAPLFHTWGFAHMALAMLLGSTLVLRRRFDPEDCLDVLESERCDSLVVIPVMLQRIMALPEERLARHDLTRVQVVASSGSALPGDLALSWMDHFGDNLYNIYGSTEVAWASIATPEDLRAAPGSAGKPPYATVVKILDADGQELPVGESGRIFVGNGLLFEGYTGGGHKDIVDGLMSTGDVGRFGDDGRLYVEGRDDEMIVSGGENVFPKEVEDCLARHRAVHDVAAVGVDDPGYGKRLRAFVVLDDGASCSEEDLKDWVKQNLARYKVPREIVFLPELPRNATGKVLKRELLTHGEHDEQDEPGDRGGSR
ncbi:AMP-binding protein [Nocardioides ferulae]|uniref:AMP-binding protein n=1 Tax=Nocardioides ferulae TaxID=2340821 RepID=UPI000EB06135|nr:AMP-binding protein [Nocardioides ferulae]